jgi:hypothetical protein
VTRYWIAPDDTGEPTLWVATSEEPRLADHSHRRAVARQCNTPPELWGLARLLAASVCPSTVREALHTAVRAETSPDLPTVMRRHPWS